VAEGEIVSCCHSRPFTFTLLGFVPVGRELEVLKYVEGSPWPIREACVNSSNSWFGQLELEGDDQIPQWLEWLDIWTRMLGVGVEGVVATDRPQVVVKFAASPVSKVGEMKVWEKTEKTDLLIPEPCAGGVRNQHEIKAGEGGPIRRKIFFYLLDVYEVEDGLFERVQYDLRNCVVDLTCGPSDERRSGVQSRWEGYVSIEANADVDWVCDKLSDALRRHGRFRVQIPRPDGSTCDFGYNGVTYTKQYIPRVGKPYYLGAEAPEKAPRVTPFYRWYDLWVGAYYDAEKKNLYLCCLGFGLKIRLGRENE